jgi:HTH-type transcriptional regulator/antitoxin HigA
MTETEYDAALNRIEQLWEATAGTDDGEELERLVRDVNEYEAKVYPMDPPSPDAAKQFRIEQQG